MAFSAVITADLVNSTKLRTATEKKLVDTVRLELRSYKFHFFRGDSFQVYMKEVADSLRVVLLCRAVAIRFSDGKRKVSSDIRASIGIGKVETPVRTLGSAKGEAFVLSGRAFDLLESDDKRLAMSIHNNLAQIALEVIANYLDAIYAKMTPKQAEVVIELLKGKSQTAVAHQLKKSNSTISQYVASGRWNEIKQLLVQFERIIGAAMPSQ